MKTNAGLKALIRYSRLQKIGKVSFWRVNVLKRGAIGAHLRNVQSPHT